MVDVETFRCLARSSPWRWSSVQLTRTTIGRENDERVRAWIRRPGLMRVETENGVTVVDESHNANRGTAVYTTMAPGRAQYRDAELSPRRSIVSRLFARSGTAEPLISEPGAEPGIAGPGAVGWRPARSDDGGPRTTDSEPEFRTPQDPLAPQPLRRHDGLVLRRPDDLHLVYDDPMYENYQWVAMLDPAELSDGQWTDEPTGDMPDRPVGVDVMEVTETQRRGRPALEALVRPTPAYNPRCTCCALLFSEVTARLLREEGAPLAEPLPVFADAHRVILDRQTGICVELRDVGGDQDGSGFDVVIEEVDASYPDEMFR